MNEDLEETARSVSCCAPTRGAEGIEAQFDVKMTATTSEAFETVDVPGGIGLLGTNTPGLPDDGESPLRKKAIKPFRMGVTSVTNADFKAFIDATGYITEAERFGWSFVFWDNVPAHIGATEGVHGVEWWRRVDGANWRDINGPSTEAEAWHADHPVVQVSWNDAKAYATWAGGRLPTEAEWEHAARGGQEDVPFPWGHAEPQDVGPFRCNIWQGTFPNRNTGADGWMTTAPARAYEANAYGLYNMVGNAWEWTADGYKVRSLKKSVRKRLETMRGFKVSKGGSFLCHRSYCYRYRIAARSGNSPDSTTTHQGFRVVWDMPRSEA